jgi:magnesium chelatase subunit H
MLKLTSGAKRGGKPPAAAPMRVVLLTMDNHLASVVDRSASAIGREMPGVLVSSHSAAEWCASDIALGKVREAIASADIIIVTMLFLEDHYLPVIDALKERRAACAAMVCAMSAPDVTRLTRMGGFTMDGGGKGALAFLKRLRPKKAEGGKMTAGAEQMRMLRRIPKILRFIPGTAQDVRAYFLTLQYWLAGSEENVSNLIRLLVIRYAPEDRRRRFAGQSAGAPVEYPDVGLYHPRLPGRISESLADLPAAPVPCNGTVGLIVLRSYVLAGNTGHYDGVIRTLEERGMRVLPVFASGLDSRPAIDKFLTRDGAPLIDALVSLTGFSLVGGPAYNDARAAEETLAGLDVSYIAAHPVELQTLEDWAASERGLLPVETTIMVAIPELDGATAPMIYGGRSGATGAPCTGCERACVFPASDRGRDMQACAERTEMLASRVARLVALRRGARAARRVAVVLFNFPPNAGNVGTAAYLSVFESLHALLARMRSEGYEVEVPADVDALREKILGGNAAELGAAANVAARIPVDDHVRRERWLAAIETQWGPAPGRQQADGRSLHVLGRQFGNVFVGIQPSPGYEGDPVRLLFERGFAPTHAFSAFYRYLREDFRADAVVHFGTHGSLEFMPGKQAGLSGSCWPERLLGDLPNVYLYASNNPSEGAIAKRRSAATLVSYLTPPLAESGLYRELGELKAALAAWRVATGRADERADQEADIERLARRCELIATPPGAWRADEAAVRALSDQLLELEYALIPNGLHVLGRVPSEAERADLLLAIARNGTTGTTAVISADDAQAIAAGREPVARAAGPEATLLDELKRINALLLENFELAGLLTALDGRYVRPAPGGDLLRSPDVLPTGRNLHGFDPFRIPSAAAVREGRRQAERLLERRRNDAGSAPRTVAVVLWGTDNLKSEGAPIAQVLALMGAEPRFDGYGRLCGARLIPLADLGRPRIDVMVSLSGIFRDLLPLQIRMLAEAAYLCAAADEPVEMNHVRANAIAYQREHGCDLETAALRVFGNADGAYGANVNNLIENGGWADADELAETYTRRKSFAFGRSGRPQPQPALVQSILAGVDMTYQNLDSVELGVTSIDTYFDTLGGITRAVHRASGGSMPAVYIGDDTQGEGAVRTIAEQVALETRTRALNPKWYESMLAHGYEGVRHIETQITNTMGWSATTGEVAPWVYEKLAETFVLEAGMRERLARLNPTASAKVASRLIEAQERKYWTPDADTLEALRRAGDELEDRLEGVVEGVAA